MADFAALLIAGLATGALYALVAVGFTLMWQTSQTINFAQGEFVMLPAFFMLAAMNRGAPYWLALAIAVALSLAILGLAFKRLLVDPMLRHGVLPLAIATMALSSFLKESVKTFYSAEASPFPSPAPSADLRVSRRRRLLAEPRGPRRGALGRDPSAAGAEPDPHRPPDAGGGAKSDGRAHPRRRPSNG